MTSVTAVDRKGDTVSVTANDKKGDAQTFEGDYCLVSGYFHMKSFGCKTEFRDQLVGIGQLGSIQQITCA